MPSTARDDRPLRLIIIGAGKMGEAHMQAFSRVRQATIVGVASRTRESAERLARRFGIQAFGTDWRGIARATGTEACVVAVTHAETQRLTSEVIDAGLHVLAEKPVAFSSAPLLRMHGRAVESSLIALAAMNRRHYPNVLDAIEHASQGGGLVGLTLFAPDPVRTRRATERHSPFVYDQWSIAQTIHALDLLRLAGGDVTDVCTVQKSEGPDCETNVVAVLRLGNHVLATIVALSSSGGEWELRLHGVDAECVLHPLESGIVRDRMGHLSKLRRARAYGDVKEGLLEQARNFVECVRTGAILYPASSLGDHAASVELAALFAEAM